MAKYIDILSEETTAHEALGLDNYNLGIGLYEKVLVGSFSLGNTNEDEISYIISAKSENSILLANISFSLDKETWSSFIKIDKVQPNEVTNTIFFKMIVPKGIPLGEGSFLLDVQEI